MSSRFPNLQRGFENMREQPQEQFLEPMSADPVDTEMYSPTSDSAPSRDNTPAITGDEYGPFPPGTIVLAKLKSFPPWPAIVIPNELVPEGIVSSKPKKPLRPTSRSKRKAAQPKDVDARLWCVRFLRDDTFMWATIKDISLLTKDQIENALKAKKMKKVIRGAYEMALDPPDVEEFIIYGSDGKPINIDNEANDEDFEDEGSNGYDDEEESEEVEDEDDDASEEEVVTKKRKRTERSTPKKTNTKPTRAKPSSRSKKPKIVQDPDTSSDEDWDADDVEDTVAVNVLSSDEISAVIKKTQPTLTKARLQLQKALLTGKDIDMQLKPTITIVESLEKLDPVHIGLVKHTGLHKVLFDILKRPDLTSRELKKIRSRLDDLVQEWFEIKIDVDEAWDFVEREEEPLVEEEDGDVKIGIGESAKPKPEVSDVKEELASSEI